MAKITLTEIGNRISKHFKRFEADEEINKIHEGRSIPPYHHAHAWQSGSGVRVRYVSFQGDTLLTREQAEQYLAWLDFGNVGKHTRLLGINVV